MMPTPLDEDTYFAIRAAFANNHERILTLEQHYMDYLATAIVSVAGPIADAFMQASDLMPFWRNYPPLQRGRAPTGTAIPWLEVGETVIGAYVIRALALQDASIAHPGLPSGADIRLLTHDALIHLDIKITGPNDRADEVVASPNQLSGDGAMWRDNGMLNSPVNIRGQRATMVFQPELAPFYVSDKRPLLCLTYFLKGVYRVERPGSQPLETLTLICAANGLLAFTGPDYNQSVPGLYIPGKDEKSHRKKRVRLRTKPLANLASWRERVVWQHQSPESG